jgi:hypothetical protein
MSRYRDLAADVLSFPKALESPSLLEASPA